jgi:ribosomal protein S18 acetylase RimI-like enzyme
VSEGPAAIRPAAGAADMETARTLFLEYADWLNVDLCFQGFEEELAGLPGAYAPPRGGLWFAIVDGAVAGTVGIRPLEGRRCEMKRLWVRPAYRGHGIGRRLAETAVQAGRAAGYRAMCLDTLGFMDTARTLYARLGFREVPAYYDNPLEDVRYLELDLTAGRERARSG